MLAQVLRVVVLTTIYLLALTSLRPGDVLVGLVLSTVVVATAARIRTSTSDRGRSLRRRLAGVPGLIGGTLVDLAKGTWATTRCLMGGGLPHGGLVEVPIPPSGQGAAAAWGIRVGFVPDTVVVELDERKGTMLLHVLDARDPDAVIADQIDSYERRQRRVFP
ncbi:multicomponent Na+:H+ antiporter subunit E [Lentzea fradiae]|uniref:Multicomponent Na+:H+ antiporter subunit E n=2 Tax=Lentzea fradiae TaxID=200378 RepID=A0A1G7KVN4_9PSEU|nr:multicomponent Na+:H+ antiporter subunit E [Lentzea fradiae]